MSKRAEEFSINYADNMLAIVDKELSETNYHRHTKMGVHIFDGSDIEQAAMDGYEQAEKDTIERAAKWIRAHWREYIWGPDADGCIGFGLWENDFKKAMEED